MRKSIQKYPAREMSATALFLATKVEEVPRKLKEVVKEYMSIEDSLQDTSNGTVDPKVKSIRSSLSVRIRIS